MPAATSPPARPDRPRRPLSVLFFISSAGYSLVFESTIRMLAERGHRIHLALDNIDPSTTTSRTLLAEQLAAAYDDVTWEQVPWRATKEVGAERELFVAEQQLGRAINLLRYRGPEFAGAPKLRRRAEAKAGKRLGPAAREIVESPSNATAAGAQEALRGLLELERSLPPRRGPTEIIERIGADVVLVSPLVPFTVDQAGYVRAARHLGVPTVFPVASWDNLTNKGLVREAPDLMTVWNEDQLQEAVDLHGMAPERVKVTGAPNFDHWFEAAPTRQRDALCAELGFDPRRPILLYVGSSPFIAPDESGFVGQWIRRLRQLPSRKLAKSNVLVRPHPKNRGPWESGPKAPGPLDGLRRVAVWPIAEPDTLSASWRGDYFDSLFFCDAVVGINTSALLEAAIVGRPCLTILDDAFSETQRGTLHFDLIAREHHGLLTVARSLDEHFEQLEDVVRQPGNGHAQRSRAFVERFIRPAGLAQGATGRLVAVIEDAAELQPPPPPLDVATGQQALQRFGRLDRRR